jgi:hypothetical protein
MTRSLLAAEGGNEIVIEQSPIFLPGALARFAYILDVAVGELP